MAEGLTGGRYSRVYLAQEAVSLRRRCRYGMMLLTGTFWRVRLMDLWEGIVCGIYGWEGCGMDEVGEKERVLWMDRERANRHCWCGFKPQPRLMTATLAIQGSLTKEITAGEPLSATRVVKPLSAGWGSVFVSS
jgi:hypothetical protein